MEDWDLNLHLDNVLMGMPSRVELMDRINMGWFISSRFVIILKETFPVNLIEKLSGYLKHCIEKVYIPEDDYTSTSLRIGSVKPSSV
jgi:hypothetical protein